MKLVNLADHLDKLKAFQAIAEAGSLREAAQRLHVTQPSLTRLIQTLEDAAGSPLLSRSRTGVQVTETGRLLLEFARASLKNLEELEEKLRRPGDRLAGHLRIGTYESLAQYLWPGFLASFRRTTPQTRISIMTESARDPSRSLAEGSIDVLVDAEPRVVGDLTSWELYEDRFKFYARPGHEKSIKNPAEMTLIYSPRAFDRDGKKIERHLLEHGVSIRHRMELDSFTSAQAFAQANLGVAVLPTRLAADAVRTKKLVEVAMEGFGARGFGAHGIYLTVANARVDDPKIRNLLKAFKTWFGKSSASEVT